jgi:hypothetical protein
MTVVAIVIDKKVMKPADWVDGDVTREQVRSRNVDESEQAQVRPEIREKYSNK